MKKLLILACVSAIVSLQNVCAWGRLGHEVVVKVAERHLTDKARKNIAAYMAYDLKTDAVWMDRHRYDEELAFTGRWHGCHVDPQTCRYDKNMSAQNDDIVYAMEVVDCNLTGEYIVCRAVAKAMISAGKPCSIINMASMSGTIVNVPQWQCSYNASKAAVMHMTKSLALEWVGKGIRVNSLSPGYIATPMSVDTPKELKDAWEPLMPMHRMGKPEELLPAILYLASDAAGYTTGSDIIVDGAYTCF